MQGGSFQGPGNGPEYVITPIEEQGPCGIPAADKAEMADKTEGTDTSEAADTADTMNFSRPARRSREYQKTA